MAEFLAYYLASPPRHPGVHGGKETEAKKKVMVKPTIQLSEYQTLLQEMSKHFIRGPSRVQASVQFFFQVLPHIPPLNPNHLHEEFIGALRHKKKALAKLADAEEICDELSKTLCIVIDDAGIKELAQAHCAIDGPDNMKMKYLRVIAGVAIEDFCLSRMTST